MQHLDNCCSVAPMYIRLEITFAHGQNPNMIGCLESCKHVIHSAASSYTIIHHVVDQLSGSISVIETADSVI